MCECLHYSLLVLLISCSCYGFNVDTSRPYRVYNGTAGSYFGYSVLFHGYETHKWLLVGAPRSNSTFPHQLHLDEPGAVFQCDLINTTSSCAQAMFDLTGNERDDMTTLFKYTGMKQQQFMGGSLAHTDTAVVTSAHLWRNKFHQEAGHFPNYFLVNGAVYQQNSTLNQLPPIHERPLVSYKLQHYHPENSSSVGVYYYARAMSGFSMHYLKDGTLLLGSPGVMNFAGGIFHKKPSNMMTSHMAYLDPHNLPRDSYMGYSVSSGYFGGNRRTEQVATGAPRYNDKGKVFIYEEQEGAVVIIHHKEGTQFGAYFGASVLVADLNKDGFDDLLVGAPMYNASRGDEGRVYVYIHDGQNELLEQQSVYGSFSAWARFGSSMTSAGDINMDTYNDVLISAPYEDEGRGAVYVYHGTSYGLNSKYSQRIAAADVNGLGPCDGFGFAMSGAFDVDDNSYADVAVGCYASDKAAIFLSAPVLNVDTTITAQRSQINLQSLKCSVKDKNVACVSFGVHFTYKGKHVPSRIRVKYRVRVDTHHLPSRALLVDTSTTSKTGEVQLHHGKSNTESFTLYFPMIPVDVFIPVRVEMQHWLDDDTLPDYPRHVLNAHLPSVTHHEFSFLKDCGDDDVCTSDLRLHMNPPQHITLGAPTSTVLDIHVENKGEAAFQAQVSIQHPPQLKYRGSKAQGSTQSSCHPRHFDPEQGHEKPQALVVCELGHPFPAGGVSRFTVEFDSGQLVEVFPGVRSASVTGQVVTSSNDTAGSLKNTTADIPIVIDSMLFISGGSMPEQLNISSAGRIHSVTHMFDVVSLGPGLLPSATLSVQVPQADSQAMVTMKMPVEGINRQCESTRTGEIDPDTFPNKIGADVDYWDIRQLTRELAMTGKKPQSITELLNCDTLTCETFLCDIDRLRPGHNVLIEVTYALNITIPKGGSQYQLETELTILPGEGVRSARSCTVETQLYNPDSDNPLSWWILAVSCSVLTGLLVLIGTSLAMWKCGFFRRGTKEELEHLIQQRDQEDDGESLYEQIPGESDGGLVQLHPPTGTAGFVALREQTDGPAVTPNLYTDGASAYPALEGYECPVPTTRNGNYLKPLLSNDDDYLPPYPDPGPGDYLTTDPDLDSGDYLTTNTLSRDPTAPLPSPPVHVK